MRIAFRLITTSALVGSVLLARSIHFWIRDQSGRTDSLTGYLILGLVIAFVAAAAGVPRLGPRSQATVAAAVAAFLGLASGAVVQLFDPQSLPRFVVLLSGSLSFLVLVILGELFRRAQRLGASATRVLAVLDNEDANGLRTDVDDRTGHEKPFLLVDILTPIQAGKQLSERCVTLGVSLIVLGPTAALEPRVIDQSELLHRDGLRVRSLDDFYDEWLGRLPVSSLDRVSLMVDIESVHGGYASLKRIIDLFGASVGALVLALVMPLVLLGNVVANRGPLFFRQRRVGKNGREFSIWKLRTMTPGAIDVSGWTTNDDPRITPFGKLLRRAHIDELPQVLNMFAGHLSIVGPRPEQVTYVRELEAKLPFYHVRHLVTPGLTGWAQVKYRYAASEEDAYVKLQYDLHYLRHESFSTDVKIIWLTLAHLLFGGGR